MCQVQYLSSSTSPLLLTTSTVSPLVIRGIAVLHVLPSVTFTLRCAETRSGSCSCAVPNCLVNSSVLDTAGQEEFGAMREQYMRSGEGFLLVFALNDTGSYNEIHKFHTQILRVKDRDDFPMVLVGNKADLDQSRAISREEAQGFARENRIHYMEASAKNRYNVDEAFLEVVRAIRKFQETESPPLPANHTGKRKSGGCPCTLL
ncbi:ras-related protein R-Ras-like isoform X1 [Oncorhynchus masou masou]|uniref:ras-related protein R-Ras-like isoform X1 n=1 Tax=Oncorhynchus masou masou TaxID=90313 RepID=UPI003184488E